MGPLCAQGDTARRYRVMGPLRGQGDTVGRCKEMGPLCTRGLHCVVRPQQMHFCTGDDSSVWDSNGRSIGPQCGETPPLVSLRHSPVVVVVVAESLL
jgi:hypothetical protein